MSTRGSVALCTVARSIRLEFSATGLTGSEWRKARGGELGWGQGRSWLRMWHSARQRPRRISPTMTRGLTEGKDVAVKQYMSGMWMACSSTFKSNRDVRCERRVRTEGLTGFVEGNQSAARRRALCCRNPSEIIPRTPSSCPSPGIYTQSMMARGMSSSLGRRAEAFFNSPSGGICIVTAAVSGTVAVATQDWGKVLEVLSIGLIGVALLSQSVQCALRRSRGGKALATAVYRMSLTPQRRLVVRGIHAAREMLECQNSLRDDVHALRGPLKGLTRRKEVAGLLGDHVQLGEAALMREVKAEGNRTVEAVFVMRGRDNASWRDGWLDGELHVVADGNCKLPQIRSLLLSVQGRQPLVLKGRGTVLWRGAEGEKRDTRDQRAEAAEQRSGQS